MFSAINYCKTLQYIINSPQKNYKNAVNLYTNTITKIKYLEILLLLLITNIIIIRLCSPTRPQVRTMPKKQQKLLVWAQLDEANTSVVVI